MTTKALRAIKRAMDDRRVSIDGGEETKEPRSIEVTKVEREKKRPPENPTYREYLSRLPRNRGGR